MGAARGTSTGLIGATHGPNQTQSPRDWGRDWRAVSDWPCAFDGVFRRGCTTTRSSSTLCCDLKNRAFHRICGPVRSTIGAWVVRIAAGRLCLGCLARGLDLPFREAARWPVEPPFCCPLYLIVALWQPGLTLARVRAFSITPAPPAPIKTPLSHCQL